MHWGGEQKYRFYRLHFQHQTQNSFFLTIFKLRKVDQFVWITLGPACNELGYKEHPAKTSRSLRIKIINGNVKRFGYNTHLQRAVSYYYILLLHLILVVCKTHFLILLAQSLDGVPMADAPDADVEDLPTHSNIPPGQGPTSLPSTSSLPDLSSAAGGAGKEKKKKKVSQLKCTCYDFYHAK